MEQHRSIKELYETLGGEFVLDPGLMADKLRFIKAYVLDWDGVFNDGTKSINTQSGFSEIDAMGTNLLRFSYWLQHKALPFTAIITGENNEAAYQFAQREHFNTVYFGAKNKKIALSHFCKKLRIQPSAIAFVFDDVLDLSVANDVGLRFLIKGKANPLFKKYVEEKQLADYITSQPGSGHGLREVTELMIGLQGNYEATLAVRVQHAPTYTQYLLQKDKVRTVFYACKNEKVNSPTLA